MDIKECSGKKALVSGATPFDPQNGIKSFKAAACETTNGEYRVFKAGLAGSRFVLVVTDKAGQTSELSMSTVDSMDRRAAQEAAKSDVKAVDKRTLGGASARPQLESQLAGADQPVANVNVPEAEAYCRARLDENGTPGRLPTNEEWEKMARGPKGFKYGTDDGTLKCGKNATCSVDNDAHASSVVGSFAANGFGVYDATGNVWEWAKDSDGTTSIRGGSWNDFDARDLRAGVRGGHDDPDYYHYNVGFRCVWPDSKK